MFLELVFKYISNFESQDLIIGRLDEETEILHSELNDLRRQK